MKNKYNSSLLMGSVMVFSALFGDAISAENSSSIKPLEVITQSSDTYDTVVDKTKGGIAKGIDILTMPVQWLGKGVSWTGKHIPQTIRPSHT